ncbi:MAG: hypothetical protein JW891_04575 [Candidatus Lokiarchaeota archaeon]|nr:hypothetical protein [Candidatus Lokiarchaeota archaeon]
MKENSYITYRGIFRGKNLQKISIEPKNMTNAEDLIDLFKTKLPEDEEGTLEIYQKDLVSGRLSFVKKVMIYKNLFLSEKESN